MMEENKKSSFWAVIPAAGLGLRMGADIPKQYLKLHDRPVLEYAVDVLTAHPAIVKVVVVLNEKDRIWPTLTFSHKDKIMTTIGGQERVHSVLSGLEHLQEIAHADDWVLVHDAVRPCLHDQDVDRLIETVQTHAVGGLLGVPVSDTLKRVNANQQVEETVSRDQVWHAQTPQMFRLQLLYKGIVQALEQNYSITDEASAIEFLGLQPQMVMGDTRNIKITRPRDLELAQALISAKR